MILDEIRGLFASEVRKSSHSDCHQLGRTHCERFVTLMDQFLPGWQLIRAELREGLLSYQAWGE